MSKPIEDLSLLSIKAKTNRNTPNTSLPLESYTLVQPTENNLQSSIQSYKTKIDIIVVEKIYPQIEKNNIHSSKDKKDSNFPSIVKNAIEEIRTEMKDKSEPKKKKKTNKTKTKTKRLNESYEKFNDNSIYIDINETSKKEQITNSDIMLSMIEIAINKNIFEISHSNTTRFFWEKVVSREIPQIIFKNYKAETLRKYWTIIKSSSIRKFTEVVKKNNDIIDDLMHIKLKPLIIMICEYVNLNDNNKTFEDYIKKYKKEK